MRGKLDGGKLYRSF